jgi:hypothetical protein
MLADGYEFGNTFERTCCRILASFFSTGEILSCSSKILMVRSKSSRRVFSRTSEESSGNDDVYVADRTSIFPNCLNLESVYICTLRSSFTYACAVPKMLVMISLRGTLSKAVVLRMAA